MAFLAVYKAVVKSNCSSGLYPRQTFRELDGTTAGFNKGDRLTGDSLTSQGGWGGVGKDSDVAPHDLRRTYAKLAHKGGSQARSDPAQPRPRFFDDDRTVSGSSPGSARCALRLHQAGSVGDGVALRRRCGRPLKTG